MKKGPFIALLVIVLIILGLIITVGLIYLNLTAEPSLPDSTYLQVDLNGPLKECSSGGFSSLFADTLNIQDLWFQIERAGKDSRIKGLVLKIGDLDGGFAKLREIGLLVKRFRSHRKPAVAFVEYGGLREYYLASFADRIYFFRGGIFNLCGPAAEAIFFKNTLSKLGIQADMLNIGTYKTGYNIFTQDRMTPTHRESLGKMLGDIYNSVAAEIAVNRRIDVQTVRSVLDESPLPRDEYLQKKLADQVGYFDEIFQYLPAKLPLTTLRTYAKTTSSQPFVGSRKVAVIFANGEIYPGRSGSQSISGSDVMGADTIAEYLRSARNNYDVKAVVLRVDSPGGSAVASDIIFREAELLAQKKPLVVSMSDMAASGGYWISLSASRILAHPQTMTGSVGVLSGKFVLKGLYDKIGVTKEYIKTTKYSGMFSDYEPFSDMERQKLLADMRSFYSDFLRRVSKSRKMDVEEVEKIAQGRVWSGESALKLKLIDQFGGLCEAIDEAKKLARIGLNEAIGLSIYPAKRSLLDLILQAANTQESNPLSDAQAKLKLLQEYFPALALPFQVKVR